MLRRLAGRLLTGIALLFAIVTITFLLVHLAPGDPARLYLGPGAGTEELEAIRRALGLDRPLLVRYAVWLGDFVRGDWGTSLAQQRPVAAVLFAAVPYTIVLSAGSLLLTWLGGIAIGLVQAIRHRRAVDTGLTAATLTVYAMPSYWLGLVLILVFSYTASRHGWPAWLRFPAFGPAGLDAAFLPPWARFLDRLDHAVLPLVTLGAIGAAGAARYIRGAVLDVRGQPFVRTARAKGMPRRTVELRHVLRNALLPVITLLGLQLPYLFSGTVFVEVIFAWPGAGREMVAAVVARDYPVVMAATAVFAALVILGNVLADLCYAVADPRVREAV